VVYLNWITAGSGELFGQIAYQWIADYDAKFSIPFFEVGLTGSASCGIMSAVIIISGRSGEITNEDLEC
jgi:hypothetical protein